MRHTWILAAIGGLLTACATMETAPPARVAELRARGAVCGDRPDIRWWDVSRYAVVRVAARGDAVAKKTAEQEFFDCVWGKGRWKTWTPGSPTVTTAPALPPVSPPPAATAAPDPPRTIDSRLQELDALRQQNRISDDEYQATRKRILDGL